MNNTQQEDQEIRKASRPASGKCQAGQPSQESRSQGQGNRMVSSAGASSARAKPPQGASVLLPPVDIFQDESGFALIANMPGIAKEKLVVRVTGNSLLIEGAATVPASGSMAPMYGEIQSPQYRRRWPGKADLNQRG